jgi:hypothetical protein
MWVLSLLIPTLVLVSQLLLLLLVPQRLSLLLDQPSQRLPSCFLSSAQQQQAKTGHQSRIPGQPPSLPAPDYHWQLKTPWHRRQRLLQAAACADADYDELLQHV